MESSQMSKPIKQFLINNGIDINNLSDSFNIDIMGTNKAIQSEFDYTLTWGNLNYKNVVPMTIHIRDIIGSFGLTDNLDFLSCVSSFYNNDDSYGERLLDKLNEDILTNINSIINSDIPIKLIEIDGKYYVGQDGNHRVFYLLLSYLTLKEKYKNDMNMLQQIESMFIIKALVNKKTGYDKIDKICYCLSKCWNDDLRITFNDEFAELQIGNSVHQISSEDEFVDYFNTYLDLLDKDSRKYNDLVNELSKIGYFKEEELNTIKK